MRKIIIREFIEPKGPITHKECTIPKDMLEYLLGIKLKEEQTEYFMDIEQYSMLLKMPKVRANLKLYKGKKYESNESKGSTS